MLELRDFPKEAEYLTALRGSAKLSEVQNAGGRLGRIFQFIATVYAIAMLVITVGVYTRNEQHPGFVLFFVACLASFYIICYNALSMEMTFKSWLEWHYPSVRSLSIPVAVLFAAIPIGILYLSQANHAAKPTVSQNANAAVASTSTPVATPKLSVPIAETAGRIGVLRDIQYLSGPNSTTVAIELDEKVQYEINRLTSPDRIYLDLHGSRLDPSLSGRKFPMKDSLLRAIRVGEHEGNVTRVTLETHRFSEYSVTPVPNSHRLLIELHSSQGQG